MDARTFPNRAQNAPRGGQDAQKAHQNNRPNKNHPRRIQRCRVLSEKVANMAPSWIPKSKQNRRKTDVKINQKTTHVGIDFWKDFDGFLSKNERMLARKLTKNRCQLRRTIF